MSVVTLKGHPDAGLPRGTEYMVVSVDAGRHSKVADGTCAGVLPLSLDPGHYIAVFTKTDPHNPKNILMRHYEEFYVDVSEDEFKVLKHLRPKFARSIQTSDGPRWTCQMSGCEFSGTSLYSVVAHEAKHKGFDLNKPGDRARYLVDDSMDNRASGSVAEEEPKGKIIPVANPTVPQSKPMKKAAQPATV